MATRASWGYLVACQVLAVVIYVAYNLIILQNPAGRFRGDRLIHIYSFC
jgi:hypothetical protein